MEYKISIHLYYENNAKIDIICNYLLPIFMDCTKNGFIEKFYHRTHWSKGPHVYFVVKMIEKSKCHHNEIIDDLVNKIRKSIQNIPYKEKELSKNIEKTLQDLTIMEEYKDEYLPICKNKEIEISLYQEKAESDENMAKIKKIYHKYFYLFEPYVNEVLRERCGGTDGNDLFWNLRYILGFAHNTLENQALPSFYLSLVSHYYSFISHPQSEKVHKEIAHFEKFYKVNKEKLHEIIYDLIKKQEKDCSSDFLKLTMQFSIDIKKEYETMPSEYKKNMAEWAVSYIDANFADKNIFHDSWIHQKNIVEIMMSENYLVNRFIINYVYLFYPTFYISPMQKQMYGYIVFHILSDYIGFEWMEKIIN